jgi:AcrR family transcriptional regulator
MAELVTAAVITGSAIDRHFASKDEILGALFDAASAEVIERLGPLRTEAHEKLKALVDAHLAFTLERRSVALSVRASGARCRQCTAAPSCGGASVARNVGSTSSNASDHVVILRRHEPADRILLFDGPPSAHTRLR